jgi:hypothetical protein
VDVLAKVKIYEKIKIFNILEKMNGWGGGEINI